MKKLMSEVLTTEQKELAVQSVVSSEQNKSSKMKELFNLGLDVKEISSILEVRYNFVYNVVQNMIIVEGVQVETNRQSSKKDTVWEMLDQGKTVKEIAIELKTNYNYIYKLKKEWDVNVQAEAVKIEEEEQKQLANKKVKKQA